MTHTSEVEIERKYDVDRGVSIPALGGVGAVSSVDDAGLLHLDAVYYDTADLTLAANSMALRRRTGGSDAGWHLKEPAPEGRTESHWPLSTVQGDADGGGVPDAVIQHLQVLTGTEALVPIARVRNIRRTTLLLDHSGVPIAELCDDDVQADDLRSGVARAWREWEIELLPGAPDTETERTRLLDEIEVAVLAAGAKPSTSGSKIGRALGRD